MKIDVSIIVVNYNTKEMIFDLIDSVKKEGSKLNWELIIIDNASRDGSKESFGKIKDDNVFFIFNDDNRGYAKANNQGIKKARGKYLLLLNSDTLVKKNAIGNLVAFAKKTPDAGVVGSRLYNADGSLQMSCYNFPSIKNAFLEYFGGKKGIIEKFAPKGNKPVKVDAVVGASFLITPRAKKSVGLLDERYWAYFEDLEYCRQVYKKSLGVYYLPSSEIVHYHGTSFKKLTVDEAQRWKRLIPSSKIYHGVIKHYLINLIILLGQKWRKLSRS